MSVDQGRAADISLDFCKAYSMVPHSVLVADLEGVGSDEFTV